tara:strand:+ start:261 stop:1232 length:972 start_codon:yes stop_codon:yes gene_type:complete
MKKYIFNRNLILFFICTSIFFIVGFLNPLFLSYESLIDILNDTSILIILALGQMFVILIRTIDLSVASNLALSGMIISLMSQINPDIPLVFFVIISCLIGAFLGLFNGILIGYLKVPFIIATLGTLSVFRGSIYFISGGKQVYAHEFSKDFLSFIHLKFLTVPMMVWISIIIFLFCYLVLNYTRFGRNFYVLGDNPEGAKFIGIKSTYYILSAFTISGLFSGLCGYLWVAKYSVASSQIAIGFELTVISACVVGGISVMGGIGSVVGCLLGSLLIGLIKNILPSIDVSQFWQLAISGIIILFAIIINNKNDKKKEKIILVDKY